MNSLHGRDVTSRRRRSLARHFFVFALAASFSALAAGQASSSRPPADVNATRIENADKEPGNWMSTGRTYDEQRFSPLKQVNDGNVGKLGLAWSYKLDIDRGVEATPIVVDGVMYTSGPFSIVYALDAKTGQLIWKYDPHSDRARAGEACCDAINRGVAVWNGKVYIGVLDGRLEAIDAKTGKLVWSTDTRYSKDRSISISGAPRIVHGKVLIGYGGAEYGVRGSIAAFDAETGKMDWRFWTVPGDPSKPPENDAMAMAKKTWFGDHYWKQGGGGTVWDSMAYDPKLNLLYFGVGNSSMWNPRLRTDGKGDNLFLASIVAVNPDTGKYVWHYQATPGDGWDFTSTAHMILADLTIAGKPRKVIMQSPKNGFFYVIDRATGKLISAKNIIPVNWAKGIDLKTGRPIFNHEISDYWKDPQKTPHLIQPAFWGAHDWQPMSYSPDTGLVYIPTHIMSALYQDTDSSPTLKSFKSVYQLGTNTGMVPEDTAGLKKVTDSWSGKLQAWNPVTQKMVWQVPYPTIYNGGVLSTAGNLVFEGTAFGQVRAYNAKTGALLWKSPANSGVMAAPVTYTVDGEQYVTFMVGWGGAFATFEGGISKKAGVKPYAEVVTYKLGGTATLPTPSYKYADRTVQAPPLTGTPAQVDKGRDLFNAHCNVCHGENAVSGDILPDLRTLSADNHKIFPAIVAGARITDGMPSFAGELSSDDVDDIHQYIIKRSEDLQKEQAGKNGAGTH